jgi:ECF sigma factor
MTSAGQVTQLLKCWSQGDQEALGRLMPVVYAELRRLARRQMARERPDHTLQVTALVHEAYLRLLDVRQVDWQDRAHFLALSAQMMRRILVDAARARHFRSLEGAAPGGAADPFRTQSRPGCTGRCLEELGRRRSEEEPGCRATFFWWTDRGRDGRGATAISTHGHARMEFGAGLALPGTEQD